MAAKCKKCDPHEICEECPEWIFTLADLIMCMMGLFVLLWVMNVSNKSPNPASASAASASTEAKKPSDKQIEQVAAIREAFGYVPDPNSSDPVDQAMTKKVMRLTGQKELGTQESPEKNPEGTDPTVTSIREGKLSAVGGSVPFGRGDGGLSDGDRKALDGIAESIRGNRNVVVVKGHASRDDFGEDATAAKNMDVSLRRAQAAADYLVSKGLSPDVLRVQGCSTFEPVRERAYTAEEQRQNRRVEVFTTDVLVRERQDPHVPSAKPLE